MVLSNLKRKGLENCVWVVDSLADSADFADLDENSAISAISARTKYTRPLITY